MHDAVSCSNVKLRGFERISCASSQGKSEGYVCVKVDEIVEGVDGILRRWCAAEKVWSASGQALVMVDQLLRYLTKMFSILVFHVRASLTTLGYLKTSDLWRRACQSSTSSWDDWARIVYMIHSATVYEPQICSCISPGTSLQARVGIEMCRNLKRSCLGSDSVTWQPKPPSHLHLGKMYKLESEVGDNLFLAAPPLRRAYNASHIRYNGHMY